MRIIDRLELNIKHINNLDIENFLDNEFEFIIYDVLQKNFSLPQKEPILLKNWFLENIPDSDYQFFFELEERKVKGLDNFSLFVRDTFKLLYWFVNKLRDDKVNNFRSIDIITFLVDIELSASRQRRCVLSENYFIHNIIFYQAAILLSEYYFIKNFYFESIVKDWEKYFATQFFEHVDYYRHNNQLKINDLNEEFSVKEWALIAYFAMTDCEFGKGLNQNNKRKKFLEVHKVHGLSSTEKSFNTKYSEVKNSLYIINNGNRHTTLLAKNNINRLNKILPFITINYPKALKAVEYAKEEENYYIDNQ